MSDIFPTRWSEPIYPSLGRKHAGAAGSDEGQAACGGLASASADDLQLNILLCQERMIERSPERFRRAYARLLFHPCAKRHGVEVKTAMHGAELKSGMLLVAEPMGRSANGMLTVAFVQRFAVLYSDMLCIYEDVERTRHRDALPLDQTTVLLRDGGSRLGMTLRGASNEGGVYRIIKLRLRDEADASDWREAIEGHLQRMHGGKQERVGDVRLRRSLSLEPRRGRDCSACRRSPATVRDAAVTLLPHSTRQRAHEPTITRNATAHASQRAMPTKGTTNAWAGPESASAAAPRSYQAHSSARAHLDVRSHEPSAAHRSGGAHWHDSVAKGSAAWTRPKLPLEAALRRLPPAVSLMQAVHDGWNLRAREVSLTCHSGPHPPPQPQPHTHLKLLDRP